VGNTSMATMTTMMMTTMMMMVLLLSVRPPMAMLASCVPHHAELMDGVALGCCCLVVCQVRGYHAAPLRSVQSPSWVSRCGARHPMRRPSGRQMGPSVPQALATKSSC
jgi:hypothetical protein